MTFIESPEFMRSKVIDGLKKNLNALSKVRSSYTKYGNNIEYLKLLVESEKMIKSEIDFHEDK